MEDKLFGLKTDLFFDLDHTLWDFERNSALAFEKVINEMELPFTIDSFLSFYVDINHAYWEKYSLNLITHTQLKTGRIRDTFGHLGYKSTEEEIEEVGKIYLSFLPQFNFLLPGANEVLEYLKGRYVLHIITNGFSEVQESKLKNSSIADYFSTITDSELAGVKKPDLGIFNYALSKANVKKQDALMIGDNLIADIKGAYDFGMDSVYYNQTETISSVPTVEIKHLIELKNLL